MGECWNSTGNVFLLLAFSTSENTQYLFFGVLLIYVTTVSGNMMIATLVCLAPQLHTPMYFFLGNLAVSDVIYVSSTLPKLSFILLTHDHRMSFAGCMTQLYFFATAAVCNIFLLTSMSYDRYVAICWPLHYSLLMTKRVYFSLAVCSWLIGAFNAVINIFITSSLAFCPIQSVNHFFCEQRILHEVTSSDATNKNIVMACQDTVVAFLPFMLIITSYVFIIANILKIRSMKGHSKAFSSCISHLITVIIFFGPVTVLYANPASQRSKKLDNLLTLLYTAVVPMLNPFVYTLRNKDILIALRNVTRMSNIIFIKLICKAR